MSDNLITATPPKVISYYKWMETQTQAICPFVKSCFLAGAWAKPRSLVAAVNGLDGGLRDCWAIGFVGVEVFQCSVYTQPNCETK